MILVLCDFYYNKFGLLIIGMIFYIGNRLKLVNYKFQFKESYLCLIFEKLRDSVIFYFIERYRQLQYLNLYWVLIKQ